MNAQFNLDDAKRAAEELKFDGDVNALLRGMNIEYEHKKLTHGDPVMTAKIAIDHIKERPDYYALLEKYVEKKNVRSFPKFYYAKHMINGLCGYEDETVLIDSDTMRRMARSMNGKPVYNYAHDERTNAERLTDLKETACGYVADTFIGDDGWLWSKLMIIDDEAHDNIATGLYSVSNAYIPTATERGGMHLNLPFDRQITNAEFTHIALVTNPRYEQAVIMTEERYAEYTETRRKELLNSLPTKEKPKMSLKFFKTRKEEVSQVDAETSIELTNSKGDVVTVTVEEMINAVTKASAPTPAPQMVKVGDKEMTLTELVNSYQKLSAKKNEKECEVDEMDNEDEIEEKEQSEDEEKENKNSFDELANAGRSVGSSAIRMTTIGNKIALGKAQYGSK